MSLAEQKTKKETITQSRALAAHSEKVTKLMGGLFGQTLLEGLRIVENGANTGRTALEQRLGERLDSVSNEASAAAGKASAAERSASTAATSATEAKKAAATAQKSAEETSDKASAMADDVEKVTSESTAAKEVAESAKESVAGLLKALTIKVVRKVGEEAQQITGGDAIAHLVKSVSNFGHTLARFQERIAKVETDVGTMKEEAPEIEGLLGDLVYTLEKAGFELQGAPKEGDNGGDS
jgi:chromosome segregation ATPase